jgi:hypothetical protein
MVQLLLPRITLIGSYAIGRGAAASPFRSHMSRVGCRRGHGDSSSSSITSAITVDVRKRLKQMWR